jgi:long-chain fatty acid transport protein
MRIHYLGLVSAAALGALVTLVTRDASAAGTALDVQSARGTGMASATTAWIDDSSAIFYNPAGIAQGKGLSAEVGVTLISPSFAFTSATTGEKRWGKFTVSPPFQGYGTIGLTENLSVGLGLFTPYGLTVVWPGGWLGRSVSTESSLQTFYANPTVAYKLGPLRIGAGLQVVRATLELQRDIQFGDQFGHADLAGGAWGVGANVGVQLQAIEQYLSLGAHYRSAVGLDFDSANVHFSNVPLIFQSTLHDQPVMGSVTMPDSLAMGVSSRPIKDLNIAVDVVWYDWKKFHEVALHYPLDASASLDTRELKNWHNTVNVHVGAEGNLGRHWMLRGGVMYDPSPSPDETLLADVPDATRVNFAIGGSYLTECGLHFDAGYQFLFLITKTSTAPQLPGDYTGFANILGLSIGYTTPRERMPSSVTPPEPPPPPPPESVPPPPVAPEPAAPPPVLEPPPTTEP